jgi:hypothetical protein
LPLPRSEAWLAWGAASIVEKVFAGPVVNEKLAKMGHRSLQGELEMPPRRTLLPSRSCRCRTLACYLLLADIDLLCAVALLSHTRRMLLRLSLNSPASRAGARDAPAHALPALHRPHHCRRSWQVALLLPLLHRVVSRSRRCRTTELGPEIGSTKRARRFAQ